MEIIKNEKPLSANEAARLGELEQIIKDNMAGFVRVGMAMEEIRAKRLYRTRYTSFDDYCREIWDMARRTADQFIKASEVVNNLSAIALKSDDPKIIELLPANEAQARELARLKKDEQVEVWHMLVNQTMAARDEEGTPPRLTARDIKKAVIAWKNKSLEDTLNKTRKEAKKNRKDFASNDFLAAFQALLEQIDIERQMGWRETSRKTVHSHLWTLLEEIAAAGPTQLQHNVTELEGGQK